VRSQGSGDRIQESKDETQDAEFRRLKTDLRP
jgi:hypothetical protein